MPTRNFFNTANSSFRSITARIFPVAISLLVYILIFTLRHPELRAFSRFIRYNSILLLPVLFVLMTILFRLRGRVGSTASFCASLSLYGLTLVGLWSTGLDNYYAISGILPWSDARAYLNEASLLLQGSRFTSFAAWHPLFPAALSVILALTQSNLQVTVAILTALVGIACYLVAVEIRRTHGPIVAAFVWVLLFAYYRQFNGTLVSENLGLIFGALGFALLWRGAFTHKTRTIFAGLFFLTVGLTSRLGTFFVLPAVIFWGSKAFKGNSAFSWPFFTRALGSVILGFTPYIFGLALLSPPQQLLFPNYASTFYDFSTGYRFWGSIRDDRPDIYALPEPEFSTNLYRLALEEIITHPQKIASGIIKQYDTFLTRDWYSVYSFIETRNGIAVILINSLLYMLCILGFVRWVRNRHDPVNGLTIAATLGVLISVPFVPPDMFNRMRLYAASLPILAALPCLGLLLLFDLTGLSASTTSGNIKNKNLTITAWLKKMFDPADDGNNCNLSLFFSRTVFGIFLIGIIVIYIFGKPTLYNVINCPAGTQAVYIQLNRGSQVHVVQNDEDALNWLPYFQVDRFKRYLHDFAPHYLAMEEFEKLQPPATILVGMDLETKRDICLVANSHLLPEPPALLGICGRFSDNPKVASDRFFYPQDVTTLTSSR